MKQNSNDSPPNDIILIHYENTKFNKLHHPQSFQYTMSKVFLCVIPFHRAKFWIHNITTHFCRTTYVMQEQRSIWKTQKTLSSYVILLLPTQQILLRIFSVDGDGKFYSTLTVLQTSVHVTMIWFPNGRNNYVGKNFQKTILTAVQHGVAQIKKSKDANCVCCLLIFWATHTLPQRLHCRLLNRLYKVPVSYPLLHSVCCNKTIKPWYNKSMVCLPPNSGLCIYTPIWW
jgi:hypothetical protein